MKPRRVSGSGSGGAPTSMPRMFRNHRSSLTHWCTICSSTLRPRGSVGCGRTRRSASRNMLQTLNTLTRSVEYVSTRNSYRMAILSPYELDRIAHRHGAGAHDVAVERQAPVELQLDPAQHADVLLERIGVKRGHDAALPQILHADDHAADLELPALPRALGQPLDAGDHDVRPQASPIGAERPDRAVRRDEEREHVKSLHAVVAHQ